MQIKKEMEWMNQNDGRNVQLKNKNDKKMSEINEWKEKKSCMKEKVNCNIKRMKKEKR